MECFSTSRRSRDRWEVYTHLCTMRSAREALGMINAEFDRFYPDNSISSIAFLLIPCSTEPVMSFLSEKPTIQYVTVRRQ